MDPLRKDRKTMTTLSQSPRTQGTDSMKDQSPQGALDTSVLSKYSEVQLLEALRSKSRVQREELKAKIIELRSHLHSAEKELARIAADDAHALAIVRGEVAPAKAGRRPGALAAAILTELNTGEKSPRELVEACGEYINSTTNKGAIMSQKLAAMRKQGKILHPSKGVWKLPDNS